MKRALAMILTVSAARLAAGLEPPEPVRSVTIGSNREFRVNGRPFFPLMGWLQDDRNLPRLRGCGMNSIAGYWRGEHPAPGGAPAYALRAREAGLYFIPSFDPAYASEMAALRDSDAVLAWIMPDEPDMPATRSDAPVTPGPGLIVNRTRPLFTMFDGDPRTSAVIDPLVGGSFSLHLPHPVTVSRFAIANALHPRIATARRITLEGDGRALLSAELDNGADRQLFPLPAPAAFTTLTVHVEAAYPAELTWGTIAEIEGLDARGRNVLCFPARTGPARSPAEVRALRDALRQIDPGRPALLTVTDFFIRDPVFQRHWSAEEQDRIYPEMTRITDAVGFDVYPIYGWNQPSRIAWVSQGMADLRTFAGPGRALYQWIETHGGGKFGDRAAPVTPVEIRCEVWQAIIRGASAIGYFTHEFKPAFSEFAVPEENRAALAAINAQITRLTDALAAPDAALQPTIRFADRTPGQCLAKDTPGALVIFAQSLDTGPRVARATIATPGLAPGVAVEVIDEARTIRSGAGSFEDDFSRLAVHLYRIPKPESVRPAAPPGSGSDPRRPGP